MSKPLRTDTVAWYKQFWPWFLIALPTIVVIASLFTVYIAVTNPDPVIEDDYYRQGLTINKKLEAQQASQPPASPDTPTPAKPE